jgi:Cu(I)/Ag(I) efflux system periplasmic protein CusF
MTRLRAVTPRVLASLVLLGGVAWASATEGEVKKIDKAQGKITLKADAIKNLDMPAMTMVFRARPPSLLDGVAEGDAVHFEADKVDGLYIVTALKKR